MVAGDLTASTPVFVSTQEAGSAAAIKAAVDALNLAATTDILVVQPVQDGKQLCIFKVLREA